MKNTDKVFMFVDQVIDGADKRFRSSSNPWVGIIIHHTGVGGRTQIDAPLWKRLHQSIAGWLAQKDDVYASAHFQVGREGEIAQIVNPETFVAFHAGTSTFWHPILRKFVTGCNDHFVGIEVLGDGNLHEYSEAQYKALGKLCAALMRRYPTIQPHCITGHEVIAPLRKVDPGKAFDWRKFFLQIYSN